MYDFFLGDREQLRREPRRFLVAVKHMLPRWANSLPDSEYLATHDLIMESDWTDGPVFVETGVGASTLLLLHHAMERGGRVISWDLSSAKASFLRQVASETLEPMHRRAIAEHWTFVSSSSLSPHTGMAILPQLTDRVNLSIHDSDHTWQTISGEIEGVVPVLVDKGIVCVDDANQVFQHTYEPIINMTRRKLGLPPMAPLPDNRGPAHCDAIPALLARHFETVEAVAVDVQNSLKDDPYYAWYDTDRRGMASVGMEKFETLHRRFVALRVSGRRR
ncbi:MAG: class I SAM-dependent methyltransferase [Alphaproteobacteria bacterium]|nr:class I SAM-dependent methyltransferase [Alphaproteobacteria bacterium]